MDKQGKEFELLVKNLEMLLHRHCGIQPSNIKTKWRHRIRGKQSGRGREVDVAIYVDFGIRTFFIAIECRDRKNKESLTWIEQLATKKRDIVADRMVAVSRHGFTESAKHSARENNIELWTLSDIKSTEKGKILTKIKLAVPKPVVRLMSFSWSHHARALNPLREWPQLSQTDLENISADFEKKRWIDAVEGIKISLKDILMKSLTWKKLLNDVPTEGQPTLKKIETKLERDRYNLDKNFKDGVIMALDSVVGNFEVQFVTEQISADRVMQYQRESDKPAIELHQFDGKPLGLHGQTINFAYINNEHQNLKVSP